MTSSERPDHDVVDVDGRLRAVRVLVALYVASWTLVRLPHLWSVAGLAPARWDGVGPLSLLDAPPAAGLSRLAALALIAAAGAFAAGWRVRVTGPLAAVLALLVSSLLSSWGQVFHTENLMVLHLLVLAVASRWRRPDASLVLTVLAVVTATTYALAGVAKLRYGGWDWLDGDALRGQVAYDNLRKMVLGSTSSPLGGWAVRQRWLWAPLASASLVVELGAPLALLGRRWASGWAVGAWGFHLGVLALMAITFPYPLTGVAFVPLLPVERISPWLRGRMPRRAPSMAGG